MLLRCFFRWSHGYTRICQNGTTILQKEHLIHKMSKLYHNAKWKAICSESLALFGPTRCSVEPPEKGTLLICIFVWDDRKRRLLSFTLTSPSRFVSPEFPFPGVSHYGVADSCGLVLESLEEVQVSHPLLPPRVSGNV